MRTSFAVLTAAILLLLVVQTDLFGQGGQGAFDNSGNSSVFGSNTFGSGGNMSSNSNSNFNSGRSSSGGGSSNSGRSNAGSMNSGATGTSDSAIGNLGGRELEMSNIGNKLFAPDRFRVGNRKAGQFVGTSLSDASTFVGAATAGGQSMAGGLTAGRSTLGNNLARSRTTGRTGQLGRTSQFGQQPGQFGQSGGMGMMGGNMAGMGRGRTQVRASMHTAFDYAPTPAPSVNTTLTRRLENSTQIAARLPVAVTVQGRAATLRGDVATEYDRILAERLVRLEPGIHRVNNELKVAPASGPPAAYSLPAEVPQK